MVKNEVPATPAIITRHLGDDETVFWWSRGSGRVVDFLVIVLPLCTLILFATAFVLLYATAIWGPHSFSDINIHVWEEISGPEWPMVLAGATLFCIPLVTGIFRYLLGPSLEFYALTDERVFLVRTWFPWNAKSVVAGTEKHAPPINRLSVYGARSAGNLRLRGLAGQDHDKAAPFIMLGIEKPLDVAHAVKSTLALDLPIEDRTK